MLLTNKHGYKQNCEDTNTGDNKQCLAGYSWDKMASLGLVTLSTRDFIHCVL